ncbi:MAG: hypothetical protein WCI22_04505, partial [Actinomycetota bacterium]
MPVVIAVSFAAMTTVAPGMASALFSTGGGGAALSAAQTVPVSATPTAVASARDVTVTWPATTLSGGTPATGYVVRRYNGIGVAQVVNS